MTTARDWLHTLWNASYKGVPFLVEKDDENGSRRIVEHEFPMRDDPYLEDLGEGVRHYTVTAYVASDSADGEASAVMAICATRGPGILVLPTHGPILVRCLEFERDRSKDRHGYIGHSLKFSREGFSGALASVAGLANLVFVAADNMAITAATTFLQSLAKASSQPDFVSAAAVTGLEDNAAVLETIRISAPVDLAASATQRQEIQAIFDAAPTIIDAPPLTIFDGVTAPVLQPVAPAQDLALRLVAVARALGDAMPAAAAVQQFDAVLTAQDVVIPPPVFPTRNNLAEVQNQEATSRLLRMAAFTAYAEAVARIDLPDRPAALTLRANVAEHFESELERLSASDIDLAHQLIALRNAVIEYLSRAVLDLAPVIQVSANIVKTSLYWAWRLYADPARATGLVARNRLQHPSFFPLEFEALAK
jgi:prophage DNA circulation protein